MRPVLCSAVVVPVNAEVAVSGGDLPVGVAALSGPGLDTCDRLPRPLLNLCVTRYGGKTDNHMSYCAESKANCVKA